jgi:hypothetical protein
VLGRISDSAAQKTSILAGGPQLNQAQRLGIPSLDFEPEGHSRFIGWSQIPNSLHANYDALPDPN